MAPELKTEVIKLGANMSEEDRAALEAAVAQAKTAGTTDAPADAPQEEKEHKPCSRCGYVEGAEAPPEEDTKEYMRSVLGGRRFVKTYDLMGGQLSLTFSTIDTKASERVNTIVGKLKVLDDPLAFRTYVTKINLVHMLKEYRIGSEVHTFEVPEIDTPEGLLKVFDERFDGFDESLVQIFARAVSTFVQLKTALIDASFDEAFYKGAGQF